MTKPTGQTEATAQDEALVCALYHQLIDGWNQQNSAAFAALFVEDGEVIGFDGSQHTGRTEIAATIGQIFAHHRTPTYVTKIKSVRFLHAGTAILRAVAGMIPPGRTELEPQLNTWQTLIAAKQAGQWLIVLFQNTPAQFHGRPDLVQRMTDELRQIR